MGSEKPGISIGEDPLLGLTVSHYRVLEVLGRGGMGVVYRGRDVRLGREVALKFLHPRQAADPSAVHRFRREARTVSALNHPSICTLLDIGQHEDREFLVMEFLQGTSVAEILRGGRQDPAMVVHLGAQVADALGAAHEQGIVHRDIKPANLFITTRSEAKILDFGVARVSSEPFKGWDAAVTDAQTASGALIGTLAYMSPEQARGEKLDGRSDIFALGAVLYEMLTGRPAFHGQTPAIVLDAILNHHPVSPGRLAPGVSDDLERVVMQALEKSRAHRQQSAADLAAALAACQSSTPRSRPTAVTVAGAPARVGRRWPLAAAGMLGAGLVAGTLFLQRLDDASALRPGSMVAVAPLVTDGPRAAELAPGVEDVLVATLSRAVRVQGPAELDLPEGPTGAEGAEESARRVGADYLLAGDLTRDGNRVRLSLELRHLGSASVAWNDTAEGEGDAFLRAQTAVLGSLAGFVEPARGWPDGEAGTAVGPSGLTTLAEYSQARAFLERPDAPENVDRAIDLLEKVVEVDPGFALGHATLGEALWRKSNASGDPTWLLPAQRSVDEAVRLDAKQPLVRHTRAEILRATGRSEDAIEELHALLLEHPDDDRALRLLGRILTDAGRTTEAIAYLQRAVALRPSSWANNQDLGVAHFYAGNYTKAAAAFRKVTELQPDLAWGYQMLGTVFHAMGETESALTHYRHAIELSPDAFALSNMGTLLYSEGRYDEALVAFEQAAALEPREPTHHRNLGDTYAKTGRRDEARGAWAEAVRLGEERLRVNPEDAGVMANLAVCAAKLGDFRSAETHADQAVERAPTHSGVLFNAALALTLAGQSERAIDRLREAVEQGYSRELILEEEDLKALRDLPDFQAVVDQ